MFKRSAMSSAVALALLASYQPVFAQAQSTEKATEQDQKVEEIVVTGIRGSLTKALDIKKDNIQITDSIVAEDIGKFPDNNVVEALQRVTGVQTTGRGGGEVSGVTIRGLGDVSTTVNGREIFTGTGRSVALADIPASLLNRVDVFKTRAADQIEGGIAGAIDIKTNRPFNFDGKKVVLAARAINQSTSEKTDPNVSMLASNRWETGAGEFGALVNVSYAETNYRDENIWIGSLDPYNAETYNIIRSTEGGFSVGTDSGLPSAPGSTLTVNGEPTEYVLLRDAMGFTDFTGKRERPAANISLQWAPNDSSEYLFETFYNGYRNQSFNSLVFINTNGISHFRNPELVEGTNVVKTNFVNNASMFTSGDGSTGHTDSWVYALGGKWDLSDRLKLKSELVHQTSDYEYKFFAMRTNSSIDRLVIDFNHNNSGLPIVAALDNPDTSDIDESKLTNASAFTMGTLYDNGGKDHGGATTWTLDADYDADWGIFTKVTGGIRVDKRGTTADYRDQSGECNPDLISCNVADIPALANLSKPGFFDGKAYVPSQWLAADGNYLLANADYIRSLYTHTVYNETTGKDEVVALQAGGSDYLPSRTFDIDELNTTLYLEANYDTELAGKRVDGQIGVRLVKVKTTMNFMQDKDLDDPHNAWTPISTETTETRALPSFTLRYSFTDDLMTRFSYGETIRRPGYGDLNPAINYYKSSTGLEYGTANGGNPNLKPAESKNYDWSLEYYFAESSSLYGVLFQRDVTGFVNTVTESVTLADPTEPSGQYTYRLTHPQNASDGQLQGAEVGLVYFPDNLPSWAQGAGIQASYTYLKGETYDPVYTDGVKTGTQTNPMYGVSENSYSLVLAYERDNYSARLSYVWREAFKTGFNGCCSMPGGIWSAPEASMDFQLSYNLTDNWVVTFDATNITDELYQGYYTDRDLYNNGSSLYARTLALGTRLSF